MFRLEKRHFHFYNYIEFYEKRITTDFTDVTDFSFQLIDLFILISQILLRSQNLYNPKESVKNHGHAQPKSVKSVKSVVEKLSGC